MPRPAIETVTLPGTDQMLNTADDQITSADHVHARRFRFATSPARTAQLRSIVVTIRYRNGPTTRTYTLTTYISSYS